MQDIDDEMKKPLLKHLVEITAHREHSRLAISVISALYQPVSYTHLTLPTSDLV